MSQYSSISDGEGAVFESRRSRRAAVLTPVASALVAFAVGVVTGGRTSGTTSSSSAAVSLASTPATDCLCPPGGTTSSSSSSDDASSSASSSASSTHTAVQGIAFANNTLGIYKRTHACANAFAAAEFGQRFVGLEESVVFGKNLAGDNCMVRSAGQTGALWSVHDVWTTQFHTGTYQPHAWYQYIRGMHGPFTDEGFKGWNEFMSYSMGFYTTDLSSHMGRWEKEGIEHLAYTYENSADGIQMYAGVLFNEHTGEVIEIHSAKVDAEYVDAFVDLPDAACEAAFALDLPVLFMDNNWQRHKMTPGNDSLTPAGLSILIPWKISWPVSDISEPMDWFEENLGRWFSLHQKKKTCDKSTCKVGEMMFHLTESSISDDDETAEDVDTPILVRYVENPDAGTNHEPWGVADFSDYITSVHERYMGPQRGWDRWVDNHIGVVVDSEMDQGFLDHIGKSLYENGVSFHAHTTTRDDSVAGAGGSIWTTGSNGLSIEIHGSFDFTWFQEKGLDGDMSVHGMSMCMHNGEMPLMQDHDESNWEGDIKEKLDAAETHHVTQATGHTYVGYNSSDDDATAATDVGAAMSGGGDLVAGDADGGHTSNDAGDAEGAGAGATAVASPLAPSADTASVGLGSGGLSGLNGLDRDSSANSIASGVDPLSGLRDDIDARRAEVKALSAAGTLIASQQYWGEVPAV